MCGACRKAVLQQAVAHDWSSDRSSLGGARTGRVRRRAVAAPCISLRLALSVLSFFFLFLQAAAALSHLWLPGRKEQSICGL